jgi:hypothetical protein
MPLLAHPAAAYPVPRTAVATVAAPVVGLRLVATGDGWSLVTPDGKLVFGAVGIAGRRRCLEFARAQGVLAVF